jgi:hypothetical protein
LVEKKVSTAYYSANLSGLNISDGALSPSFNVDVTSYSTWEESTVTSVTVTPTAENAAASITVNGTAVASGTASGNIALVIGPNSTITIEVTAEDGNTTRTYKISPYRAVGLPKTGQTTSDVTGDDGDLQRGVPWPGTRFTDNGDGTVTDNLTGLMWVEDGNLMTTRDPTFDADGISNDGLVTWEHALDYVALLNSGTYADHSDWRLPNPKELRSLVNYEESSNVNSLNSPTGVFTGLMDMNYWTSCTYAPITTAAWDVYINIGSVYASPKTFTSYVLAVRTGQGGGNVSLPKTGQTTSYAIGKRDDGELELGVPWPNPRFTDNGDGTVTDNLTGLVWLRDGNRFGQRDWADALSGCNGLADDSSNLTDGSSAGDWRLPNVNELESLINAEEADPAAWLNAQGFSGVQAGYYWSSSNHAPNTDRAWFVDISKGTVGHEAKINSYYVLAVRAGQ